MGLGVNDDFQHGLARHFRVQKLYYERRRNEWSHRRTELKNLGIKQGPDIKGLMQLIACFYWDSSLGPVVAKRELGQLFDGKYYDQIKRVSPEIAYQLYLLQIIIQDCVWNLAKSKQYVRN